jgi:Protein of unknown function (DUF3313)
VLRNLVIAVLSLALVQGCAETKQARDVGASGFLGTDYARLKEGGDGKALLVYRDASAAWASYDKVRLDPVTIWMGAESAFDGISAEDRQKLADDFYTALHKELSQDYQLVDEVGPSVMRSQVALTDAQSSYAVLDTISTVVPIGLAISQTKGLITGKPSFVGETQAESKVTDGATGELLAAAIDRRVGGKSISGSIDSWDDVHSAFDYWAKQLRYRLCTERGGQNCQMPE